MQKFFTEAVGWESSPPPLAPTSQCWVGWHRRVGMGWAELGAKAIAVCLAGEFCCLESRQSMTFSIIKYHLECLKLFEKHLF